MRDQQRVHPYVPNSEAGVREIMLREIGVDSIDDLLVDIPEELRMEGKMHLPEPFPRKQT